MSEKKIGRCKFAFPNIKDKEGKTEIVHYCHNPYCEKESEEINDSVCESCENFKSRYIEYPITVSKIEQKNLEYNTSSRMGSLVKIRPCGEEYGDKTYLGVLLGDLPTSHIIRHNSESNVLTVDSITNPAIYVFELKKIVFGYESWWGVIESEDELKDITDEDIGNIWYVQLLKAFPAENKENKEKEK